MTNKQGLGQSSHVLIRLEKRPQTGTSFNHNMTFLNQPAVKLDVKQSMPQCGIKRLSPTSPGQFEPLFKENHPKIINKSQQNKPKKMLLQ